MLSVAAGESQLIELVEGGFSCGRLHFHLEAMKLAALRAAVQKDAFG